MKQKTATNNTKEVTLMNQATTSTNNHNQNTTQEETTMKNPVNKLATATLNMTRYERLAYVNNTLLVATKTSDKLYIDKETLVQFLYDNDIISRMPSKSELKRTKREVFKKILFKAAHPDIFKDEEVKTEPTPFIPIGDLEITRDNAPQETIAVVQADKNDALSKTDKLFGLLKKYAADNEKKGYGYTISSWMLQAAILEAGTGLTKFKGHKITEDEFKLTQNIYNWLKTHEYIKPVIYSVKEDDKVRVYMPEYTGRTESTKTKLIPFNKSAGYTAKQCTSFLVTVK